jgi:hypothetical protein
VNKEVRYVSVGHVRVFLEDVMEDHATLSRNSSGELAAVRRRGRSSISFSTLAEIAAVLASSNVPTRRGGK